MELVGGYLLIIIGLFAGNMALLLGNSEINKFKFIALSSILFIISFGLLETSIYFNYQLIDYLAYIFFAISILIFLINLYCLKKNNYNLSLILLFILFLVSILLISSQTNVDFFSILIYSFFTLVIFFVIFQLSKLLQYAKRQYSVIVGEYMTLFSILMFIFALTYNSTLSIDYSMFSAFLILTPTYQLIYVVIAIIVILIIGVIINEFKEGK